MYRLTSDQQAFLLTQPEAGMGYQFVDLVTDTGQGVEAVVYNAELTLPWSTPPEMRTLYAALAEGRIKTGGPGLEVREIRLRMKPARKGSYAVLEDQSTYGRERRHRGPAKEAPVEETKAGELFRRFSAYANDRRITADRRLLPGTYGTTHADSQQVLTGKQAVERYALPNPDPAVHRFTIMPHASTSIQYGVVEPAHGQPGGGVEVIFTQGTNAWSVIAQDKIPPC